MQINQKGHLDCHGKHTQRPIYFEINIKLLKWPNSYHLVLLMKYNVHQDLGQQKYQFQLKGKGKLFNDQRENGVHGPENYQPQISLIVPNGFQKIPQGIGEKKNPFQSLSFNPGPRRYEQNSGFDKVFKKREFITKPGERRSFI
ncbi:unnamed protein product [Paramecium pentaurelia]|uniref:Uncharacterized protein n=1 Tax=Paramecium pentaurelia TaxID=43138 RepID=A0A8S1XK80_9CILI|nr:unnamed protein product [Paramecium pentaurelia]